LFHIMFLQIFLQLVRTLRRAQPNSDTIVGITYDYRVRNHTSGELEEITQEIWVGKFTLPGQDIEWTKIEATSKEGAVNENRLYSFGGM